MLALVAGCEPLDVAEGKTPAPSDEVRTLQDAVASEQNLIDLYAKTIAAYSGLSSSLAPLLAQHRAHLAKLRGTVSYPAGTSPPASGHVSVSGGGTGVAVRALRSAESAAAAAALGRLPAVSAGNAQLLASIATCESLHLTTLEGLS